MPGAFEDIDYLLQNIVDPNAIIGKDYQQTVVQMKKGETLIGIVGAQDSSSLTLKTLGGTVTVQRGDIAQLTVLDTSLMPRRPPDRAAENRCARFIWLSATPRPSARPGKHGEPD